MGRARTRLKVAGGLASDHGINFSPVHGLTEFDEWLYSPCFTVIWYLETQARRNRSPGALKAPGHHHPVLFPSRMCNKPGQGDGRGKAACVRTPKRAGSLIS